jgi:hypothetical protein
LTNPKKKNKKSYNKLLERIDRLELAQNLMWENHNNEKDPYKRTVILEKIIELQPCIWTAYYKARKQLFEMS